MNPQIAAAVTCPLCERAILPAQRDEHRRLPKCKGGRQTQFLHRVCHRQVHAAPTETELARRGATVEAVLQPPDLNTSIERVITTPDDFFRAHPQKLARAPTPALRVRCTPGAPRKLFILQLPD